MEIKIGIQNVPREATLNVDMTMDDVIKAYSQAQAADSHLCLTDASGRHMLIPASGIAYIEFGQEHTRPVGFGT